MKIPAELIENFVVSPKEPGAVTPNRCVWLDVEGRRLLATDGHVAMRVSCEPQEGDVSGLLPVEVFDLGRKELKAIAKIKGKNSIPDPWLKVICGDDSIIIENLLTNTTHLVTRRKLQNDETFPNVDAVFPVIKAQPTVTVSMTLLNHVMRNIDPDNDDISLWIQAPDQAVVMATQRGAGIAVLMPMKAEQDLKQVNIRGKATKAKAATQG